ncbi:MAG: peptidoglycan-binding protein [bacterium]|nr:peptidoglycan-binding protein [bacterium]
MKQNYSLSYARIAAGIIALAAVPAFVFAQQIIGLEADLTGGNYHVGTDATNGVVTITVSASDINVTLNPGQFIRLNSTGRKEVTLSSSSGLTVSSECTAAEYIFRAEVSSGGSQTTFTITPNSTTCSTGGSSGTTSTASGGGGGGGGGGSGSISLPSSSTVLTPTVTPAPTPATPIPTPSAPVVSASFGSDLGLGSRGGDVTRLQQLLASDSSIYPEGTITGYYGNLTVKAVRAFQAKYGISQVGRVGPATRAKLSEVFGAGQPPAAVSTPSAPVAVGLTRELNPGARNNDVKALQEFLAKDKDIYPEGLATGYYGPATTNAVKRFQAKYGISTVGRVGPATLKKLQELMGAASVPAPTSALTPTPALAPTPTPTPAPASVPGLTPDPETTGGFQYRTESRP